MHPQTQVRAPLRRNGWGSDPHLTQMAPLTVVSEGMAFRCGIGCGWGQIRCWRALLNAGKLAMLRRMPQHAASPLTHAPIPSEHLPQLPPTTSTNTHQRWHGGGVGDQPPPPHGQSTCPTTPHTSPTTHNTHASHACPHTATHTCTHTPPPAGHSDAARGRTQAEMAGGVDRLV